MFLDYFWDETNVYVDKLETLLFATQYEVSCKGVAFYLYKGNYLLYYYDQVRASENCTEAEVS